MDAELYKPFKLMFSVFKTLGMCQDGNQTWFYFIFGYLFHFIFIELCLIGEIIYAINAENLEDLIETMGLTTTYACEMFKCWNFFYKLRHIKKTIEMINLLLEFSADERIKSRDHVKSQVAFGFKVYKIFWLTAWITCVFSSLVPFVGHKLPYKVWFPFDIKNSEIGFWIASISLIINSFVVSAIDVTLDMLPVIFMTFAIGLINKLSERLENIKIKNMSKNVSKEKAKTEKEFIKCIKIQQKINDYIKEIHGNFSTIILIQGLFSSIILCTGAFTMSTVS
jgi:7tm Odorant receptor